ncbi:hypothetical protein N8889_00240 [Candidatus Pelagibacter ubique]|jgi:hypothetical protein|nr:hypothetical protein [Candidatus Pelagibacter ubique]
MKTFLSICCKGPKNKNIGAYLTILQEILLLSQIYKKKKVKFFFNNNVNKKFFYETFLQHTKLDIEFVKKKSNNFINLELIKKKDEAYSLSRINYLYKLHKIKPLIEWNNKIKKESNKIIKQFGLKKFIIVTLKRDLKSQKANAKILIWEKIFQLLVKKKYKIVIIGNDKFENSIKNDDLKNHIIALNNYKFTLASQFELVNKAKFFIGTASGMCMAACFSKVPYAIFKHPNHHTNEMKNELLNDKVVFSAKKQLFYLKHQNFNTIKNAIKDILN